MCIRDSLQRVAVFGELCLVHRNPRGAQTVYRVCADGPLDTIVGDHRDAVAASDPEAGKSCTRKVDLFAEVVVRHPGPSVGTIRTEKGILREPTNARLIQFNEIGVLGCHGASRVAQETTIASGDHGWASGVTPRRYPGPMNDAKTFGQAVREARLAKGMSMGQLAAAVERSTASVRRWERDEGVPAETVVRDLIAVLDLEDDDYPGLPSRPPSVGVASDPSVSVSESMRATSLASASPSAASGPLPAVSPSRLEQFRDPHR